MTPGAALALGAVRPVSFSSLLRHDVVPVGCAFLAVVAMEWAYLRASAGERAAPAAGPPPGWRRLVRYVVGLTVGGYLAFAAIVGVFYFVLGDAGSRYLRQGFGLGAALAFGIALPGLLAAAGLAELWRRLRGRPPG